MIAFSYLFHAEVIVYSINDGMDEIELIAGKLFGLFDEICGVVVQQIIECRLQISHCRDALSGT